MKNRKILASSVALGLFATTSFTSSANVVASHDSQESRIIGGTQSKAGEWPFMTALLTKGNANPFTAQFCGASYIGNGYVLTASHCVEGKVASDIEVSIGENNLNQVTSNHRIAVSYIYMHEDYGSISLSNDIAILKLAEKPAATSVKLAPPSLLANTTIGTNLTVMGWGNQDNTGGQDFKPELYQVDVPLQEWNQCKAIGGNYSSIGEDAFCAGYDQGGKDSCQGDSGGPLVFDVDGVTHQLGVVSWGDGCAIRGKYGVYADVGHFAKWISQHTYGFDFDKTKNFGFLQTGQSVESELTFTNTTDQVISFNNIKLPNDVELTKNSCASGITAGSECTISIKYAAKQGENSHRIIIETDHPEVGTVTLKPSYTGYASASQGVTNAVSIPNSAVLTSPTGWYLSGNEIKSGMISDNQSTSLIIKDVPKGKVSLTAQIRTEENFDFFVVRVNGKVEFASSGNQTGVTELNMPQSLNQVEFLYIKDGLDVSHIYNEGVLIQSMVHSTNNVTSGTAQTGGSSSSSGGGSTGPWWVTALLAALWFRRRR